MLLFEGTSWSWKTGQQKKTDAAVIRVRRLFLQILRHARLSIFFILFYSLHILDSEKAILLLLVKLQINVFDNGFVIFLFCWCHGQQSRDISTAHVFDFREFDGADKVFIFIVEFRFHL